MTNPTRSPADPVAAWQQLYLGAPHASPSVAAAVAAAFRIADVVWRQVAADPTLDPATRLAVTDETAWARTALAVFGHLSDTRAYTHLDLPAPLRCWADQSRLRSWLTGPSTLPGYGHTSVSQSWGIDDDFTWDTDGVGTTMATLVEQAQNSGVFGVAGYRITLRQVTTDDPDTDPVIEHQVALTTPSGATLVASPMAADHLTDDLSGVDAAVAVLTNTAAVVNELLTAERRLTLAAADPDMALTAPARPVRPGRGFTALDLTAPGPLTTAIEAPPPRPDRPPRR